MNLPDIKKCPYCNHEGDVEYFSSWEKGGQKGLLGRTSDGCLMLACPKCKKKIKYNTRTNKFLNEDEGATSTVIANLVLWAGVAFIIYWLINYFF